MNPHPFPLSQAERGKLEPPFSTREKGGDEGIDGVRGTGKHDIMRVTAGFSAVIPAGFSRILCPLRLESRLHG